MSFFEAALDDLDSALDWYLVKSPPTVQNFFDIYLDLLDRVSESPMQFPKVRQQLRKARFPKSFSYNIYFFISDDTVFIVAIFHDKRNSKIWKERL